MTKVYIDGEIGWDVLTSDVMDQLVAGDDKKGPIELHINSPGGSVFDGYAIMTALHSSGRPVDVYIDGLAASMASAIAMVGRTITMSETSAMMIHSPWSFSAGNAKELRKEANVLDLLGQQLAGYYRDRSGQPMEVIQGWLDDETWFTPESAIEAGLADSMYKVVEKREKKARTFDLSGFHKVPNKIAALYGDSILVARNAEKALRDAGYSRKVAKSILSGGLANLRDADEKQEDEDTQTRAAIEQVLKAQEEAALQESIEKLTKLYSLK